MRTIAGMATFKGRERSLVKALESIAHQVDEVILYDNSKNPDLADNGKFYGLTLQEEPCYYFTLDDDLEYPSNYVHTMIQAIDKHKTIVTHHGRILLDLDVSYYRGHKGFRCLDYNGFTGLVDVAGTGVSAFRTDIFNPLDIWNSEDKRMSDLVFSLEASKQGKQITILEHNGGWIKQLPIDHATSIAYTEGRKEERQIQLANEIWRLNYQSQPKI